MRERRLESCEHLRILCDLLRSRKKPKSKREKWRLQDMEVGGWGGGVVIIVCLANGVFRFLTLGRAQRESVSIQRRWAEREEI